MNPFFRPKRKYSSRPSSTFSVSLFNRPKSKPGLIRFETNASKSKRKKILFSLIAIITASALFLFFTRSTFFHLAAFETSGNTSFSKDNATALLSDFLGANIFFVDTDEIKSQITAEFPTIQDLKVSRHFPNTIQISAADFPVAWVLTQVGTDSAARFLLNTAGFISGSATPENAVDLPVLELHSDQPLTSKTAAVEPALLSRLLSLSSNLQTRFDLKVIKFTLLETAAEIHILLSNNWQLFLTLDQDWDLALQTLAATLRGQDLSSLSFSYIDLRIPDKVFFKER